MIIKLIKVRDYAYKIVRYLFGPGRHNEHTDPHLIASWNGHAPDPGRHPEHHTVAQLAARLDLPLKALPKHQRPATKYLHIPLRAAPEDRHLSDTEWATIARRVLHTARLAPTGDDDACRWIAVRHAPDHIHLLVTLVRNDGRAPDLPRRLIHTMRREIDRVEADLGLRRLNPGDGTAAQRPSHRPHFKARRTGQPSARAQLRNAVRQALAHSTTVEEFLDHLTHQKIIVTLTRKPSGDIRGITFALPPPAGQPPIPHSGSTLAPDLSLPKLLQRLHLTAPIDTPAHNDPWRQAARTLATLPTTLRNADNPTAAGHIHAFGTLLDATASAAPPHLTTPLHQAALAFERATRSRVHADHRAGRALRELAHQLTRPPAAQDTTAWLICTAIAATLAIARWHEARRYHQQQAAAHQTLAHLRTAYHHATRALTTPTPTTDPRITTHWATVLHTTHPNAAPHITTHPDWPTLAATLHTTPQPETALATAPDDHTLTHTDHPTALLHHHLHDHTFQHRHNQGAHVPGAPTPTPRTRRSH